MQNAKFLFSLPVALALSSCTSYEANPIDLFQESEVWISISDEATNAYSKLTLEDAQALGVILNPELNRARAQLAKSKSVEKESGWWQDPSFGFDLKRSLTTSTQAWTYTPGFSLTIPVTGLPSLEKEVAAHYSEADFWTLVQAELDFRTNLAKLWIDYTIAKKKQHVTKTYLERTARENAQLEHLAQVGEISQEEMQAAEDRQNAAEQEKYALNILVANLHSEILRQLGIAPRSAPRFELITEFPENVPELIPAPTPEQLAGIPKIRASLAQYAANESSLKTEIRRQYPELQLNPSYEVNGNDEFTDFFTLGVGFTLPLWNRNKRGIAEAQGDREIARIETIALWQEQLHESHRLEYEQTTAQKHCQSQFQRMKNFQDRLCKIYDAIKIGETSPSVLSDAAHQDYMATLAALDAFGVFHKIRVQVLALRTREPATE